MSTTLGWTCFAVVSLLLLMWCANRMLYYPAKYPAGDWSAQQALGAMDVVLNAADGTKLHAWWIEAPQQAAPRIVTLHLHGNAGNITYRGVSARNILLAGSSVLLLDYRGYGKSAGSPAEAGLYQDAEAAYDWILSQGYTPKQIVIHGESLGTAVAMHLATRRKSAGLVLEAPFTSASAVAGKVVPFLGPLLVSGYNSLGKIRSVGVPVLIVHGDHDEVIAYEFGQQLFEAANEPKIFWTIPGATHNDLHMRGGAEFAARLRAFYRSLPSPM